MSKKKRKQQPAEKHGYDGRPPIKVDFREARFAPSSSDDPPKRNANHCTLCRLEHLGLLRDRDCKDHRVALWRVGVRYRAGVRLQDDYSNSGAPLIRGNLGSLYRVNRSITASNTILSNRIDADKRVNEALAVVGEKGATLLTSIVLHDSTLTDYASDAKIQANGVLPALLVALDVLARHYGMDQLPKAVTRGGAAQPIHPFAGDGEKPS